MFTLNQPVFVIIESLTRRSLRPWMHAVDHRERDDALAVEFSGRQGDVVDGDRLLSTVISVFPLALRSAAEVPAIDFIRSPAIFASCRIPMPHLHGSSSPLSRCSRPGRLA